MMKHNTLKLPLILMVSALIVAITACLLANVIRIPTVTEQDFRYLATYKLDGETKTIEGIYHVDFDSAGADSASVDRYYTGYYVSDPTSGDPKEHTIATKDGLELRVVFIFTDDYLMGDGDIGEVYSDVIPDPYLAVYDDMGCEYVEEEYLGQFDAELISWETPQPIKNSFVFKGFSLLHNGSMSLMLLVGLLLVVACMIFVKKDETVTYLPLDKISMVLNWLVALVALPFISLVVAMMDLVVSGDEFFYQVGLCVPAVTAFALAASLCLRRKGFTKMGFFIQFVGPVLFVLTLISELFVS